MASKQTRSIKASHSGIEKLKKAKQNLSYEKLAEKTGVSPSTVKRFFYGKAVDIPYAEWITEALNLELKDIVETPTLSPQTNNIDAENKILIHRQTCKKMLREKIQLTTNPLTTGDGTIFDRAEIYIPLGLVDRPRQPKRTGNCTAEMGSQLYAPTDDEITKTFELNQFFEQVLRQRQTPKSQGKRIAVIGEPGAGKTTLLQQIGEWVFAETEQDVAIWVSLADLQGKTIEEYLLQVWLKNAFQTARVKPEMEDALVELFNRGWVWLLLDGVDEMAVDYALGAIASQFTGWVGEARVVLSCRLNVWDADKNALFDFDVFRNLDFSELQVAEFIGKWFASFELGERLNRELKKPGKERIRDLVKNPLRLALLCYSWQRRQGKLPTTKAALYQRFVEVFYEWKQEFFPTTSGMRKELNLALGRLGQLAISQTNSRFRLSRQLVCQILGETDSRLFQLAIKLGWLNQVGVAVENPELPVYAFFHPTFQEYFAALAVENWRFFFNHIPDNINQGIYRIFQPEWKQIFLLWLGRDDVDESQRLEFFQALTDFDDGCGNFYRIKAYSIALDGFDEPNKCSACGKFYPIQAYGKNYIMKAYFFANDGFFELGKCSTCDLLDQVLKQCVQWDRLSYNWGERTYHRGWGFVEPSREIGDPKKVEILLENLKVSLTNNSDEKEIRQTFEEIGKFGAGNSQAVTILLELLEYPIPDFVCAEIARTLGRIAVATPAVIDALVKLLETSKEFNIILDSMGSLPVLGVGNQKVIDALIKFLKSDLKYECFYFKAADTLWRVNPENQETINCLNHLIQNTKDNSTRVKAAWRLGEIDPGNSLAISTLVNEMRQGADEASDAFDALEYITKGDKLELMKLMHPYEVGILKADNNEWDGLIVMKNLTDLGGYNILKIGPLSCEEVFTISGKTDLGRYNILKIGPLSCEEIFTISGEEAKFIQAIFQGDFAAAFTALEKYLPEYQAWEKNYLGSYKEMREAEKEMWEEEEEVPDWGEEHYRYFNPFFLDRTPGCFVYQFAESFLWSHAGKMNYPDFYQLCHS